MPTVEISEYENSITVHFGTDDPQINAYTLASTLVGLADAAKAANTAINPGYEIEVVVVALGEGSFKATLNAVYREAGNLFTADSLRGVVIGVVATFIYESTFSKDDSVNVNVTTDEVIIEQGETRIVVPREVYEATRQVEGAPDFRKGMGNAIRATHSDAAVSSLGISPREDREPPIQIPRDRMLVSIDGDDEAASGTRETEEVTDLQIVRAVLERSRKRWQFIWHGMRISGPVLDGRFYDEFYAHRITIAPGDVLRVRLRIRQSLNVDLGVYINSAYEVIEVLDHFPRPVQPRLGGAPSVT